LPLLALKAHPALQAVEIFLQVHNHQAGAVRVLPAVPVPGVVRKDLKLFTVHAVFFGSYRAIYRVILYIIIILAAVLKIAAIFLTD